MTLEGWAAIVGWNDAMDAVVDAARERLERLDGAGEENPGAFQHVLATLHVELRQRFDILAAALAGAIPPEGRRRRVLAALCIFLNERARVRLPEAQRCDYEPLIVAGWDAARGGEAFFELEADAVSGEERELDEVRYFCLANGFAGKYVDDPGGLTSIREHLRRRLDARGAAVFDSEAPAGVTTARLGRFGLRLAVVLAVVSLYLLLVALTD